MEQMQEENIKSELVKRDYDVQEDGKVIITEDTRTIIKMTPQEFVSFMREHENRKTAILKELSEEYQNKAKENLAKIEKQIDELTPICKDSEDKAKQYYEKMKLEGMLKKIKEEIGKPMGQINKSYIAAVWDNLVKNEQALLEKLSEEEKHKFFKIKLQIKAQQRGKKKGQ